MQVICHLKFGLSTFVPLLLVHTFGPLEKVVTLIEQSSRLEDCVLPWSQQLIDHSGTLGNIMEHLHVFLNENYQSSTPVQSTDCIHPMTVVLHASKYPG